MTDIERRKKRKEAVEIIAAYLANQQNVPEEIMKAIKALQGQRKASVFRELFPNIGATYTASNKFEFAGIAKLVAGYNRRGYIIKQDGMTFIHTHIDQAIREKRKAKARARQRNKPNV